MDWIIILLIVVGAISRARKKKQQQAQKQMQQRQAAFREAAKLQPQDGAHFLSNVLKDVGREIKDELKDEFQDELPPSVQKLVAQNRQAAKAPSKPVPVQKRSYSKEEWQKLFASSAKPAVPTAEQAKPVPKSATPVKAPAKAPSDAVSNNTFSGMAADTAYMEGESPLEHAAHRQRIVAEEERIHREHTQLKELRSVNLQKLRSAVVMSEVLGKPVSLRPRGSR